MLNQSYTRLIAGLDGLSAYVRANQSLRHLLMFGARRLEPDQIEAELWDLLQTAPSSPQWAVLDHCAAVGRIYALFEQFAEGQLAEWIAFCTKGSKFADLPARIAQAYAIGFANVLGNLDKVRYRHLFRDKLVSNYNAALQGDNVYELASECFTYHANNIRWEELCEIYGRGDITSLEPWVSTSPHLSGYYGGPKRLGEQVKAQLRNFVQYRNDAAHGVVAIDEVLGTEELLSQISFFRALCSAIHDLIHSLAIQAMLLDARACQIGVVTEMYSDNRLVANLEGASLSKGDMLFAQTDRSLEYVRVTSIRLNDADVETAVIANAQEVGLQTDVKVSARAKLIVVNVEF